MTQKCWALWVKLRETPGWFYLFALLDYPWPLHVRSMMPFVFPQTPFIPIQLDSVPFQRLDTIIEHGSKNGVNLWSCSPLVLNWEWGGGGKPCFLSDVGGFLFCFLFLRYGELLNTKWILHQNKWGKRARCVWFQFWFENNPSSKIYIFANNRAAQHPNREPLVSTFLSVHVSTGASILCCLWASRPAMLGG